MIGHEMESSKEDYSSDFDQDNGNAQFCRTSTFKENEEGAKDKTTTEKIDQPK